jgi:uncharacterized protein YggE
VFLNNPGTQIKRGGKTMNGILNRGILVLTTLLVITMLSAFTTVWLFSQSSSSVGAAPLRNIEQIPLQQAGVPVTEQARINVQGTGIVTARPDTLYEQIGVVVDNPTLADAQWDAGQKINDLLGILKDAGVEDKDIATTRYGVDNVMEYPQNQPPRRVAFRVTHILTIKVRDIDNSGKLIDRLVAAGANSIGNITFGFSNPDALLKQARDAAMNDAFNKGQQYARLGGVTLGLPILIQDAGANTPPAPTERSTGFYTPGSPNTTISPGQQEVRVDVNVVYSIK